MKSQIVSMDFKKLNAFIKGFGKGYAVDVGILGKKNARSDGSGKTNAEIGFTHEFGTSKIPKRSFLRFPIMEKSDRIMKEVARDVSVKKLAAGNMVGFITDLGIAAERAVMDAFDTGGWGYWQRNAPSTIRRKGSSQPLIDLGFLRRSISSQVVKV